MTNETKPVTLDTPELLSFIDKLNELRSQLNSSDREVRARKGRKYIKIVTHDPEKGKDWSAFCFIDQNGDVLKPASWSAPAKHARSNIFNAKNGMDGVGLFGCNYL